MVLELLSRPTAQQPLCLSLSPCPLLPPPPPFSSLTGSLHSQASPTSNKFQLQKLIRGPMALALKAPSVSSKSHGLGAGSSLKANVKQARALTPAPPEPTLQRVHASVLHHSSGTFSIISSFWFVILLPGSISSSISQRQCLLARAPVMVQILLLCFPAVRP